MRAINTSLFFVATFFCHGQPAGKGCSQLIDMRVLFTPDVVMIDAKPTVYYELRLTRNTRDSIHLRKLEVFDVANATIVFTIGKEEIKKRSGSDGVIYLEFSLTSDKPDWQLRHRLQFDLVTNPVTTCAVEGGVIKLSKRPAIILGPPLRGGPWAAVYDPSWQRGHRRVVYRVNGQDFIPGRFAIDFIKLDDQGRYAEGDDNTIKNWYGYGSDVLAVADGVVASTRDDFSESPTLSTHPKYTSVQATGNYVSISLGDNHVAFYEHLRPRSIKVKPGQKVKRGDIIASLGFTGQTTGPHLHFHLANENSPLGAEGIPFVFERFTILGSYSDFGNFGKSPWEPVKNLRVSEIVEERPASNSVIKF